MIALGVVAGLVLLMVVRSRHKRVSSRQDMTLAFREDRTAHFARRPRRFGQRGML